MQDFVHQQYEMGLGFRVPFQAGAEWRGTCSLDAALLFKLRMTVQGTIGDIGSGLVAWHGFEFDAKTLL